MAFVARLPWWTWVGLALNLASWASSWSRVGPWAYTFFPIWLGFILFLDGVNVARKGSSLLTRNAARFALLFPMSSVFWWVFEWMNGYVRNWTYTEMGYTPFQRQALATLYFATVLPVMVEMFELFATFRPLKPLLPSSARGPRLSPSAAVRLVGLGVFLLWLPIAFPRFAYMLIWLCLIFLLDPLNNLAGRPSAFGRLLARDWRFFLALPLSGLACGLFWEMWNFRAQPKWMYHLPYLDWTPHYFEMPLPGMLGYLPFAVEVFAMYQISLLALGLARDELVY